MSIGEVECDMLAEKAVGSSNILSLCPVSIYFPHVHIRYH